MHRLFLAAAVALAASVPTAAAGGGDVRVSSLPGPQDEATIAVDPLHPRVLLAGSNDIRTRFTRGYESVDGGLTWARAAVPRPARTCFSSDPVAAIDATGREYFGFVAAHSCSEPEAGSSIYVVTRPGPGTAWSAPRVRVAPVDGAADDKPALAVDAQPASPHLNRVYAAWTRFAHRTRTLLISHSDDAGAHWSEPVRVNDRNGLPTFASIAIGADGTVYVAWFDAIAGVVHLDRSADGGAAFGRDVVVGEVPSVDDDAACPRATAERCPTAVPTVAVDSSSGAFSGRVYVVYEGHERSGSRVLAVAYGPTLDRATIGTTIGAVAGADQFFPSASVDPSTGTLWACFYTSGAVPRARMRARYVCARSRDGARTWTKPVRAASVASDESASGADDTQYGDYEGVAAAGGVAHVVWTDSRDLAALGEEIYTTTLADARRS